MINLRAVANSQTKAINPNHPATLFISNGNQVVNFKQVAVYRQFAIVAEVQPLSSKDIRQLDALNVQGAEKSIYLNGSMLGISRIKQKGGDLIMFPDGTFPEGNLFLVLAQLELWGGGVWSHVAVVLQDDNFLAGSLTTDLSDPDNEVIVPTILTGI